MPNFPRIFSRSDELWPVEPEFLALARAKANYWDRHRESHAMAITTYIPHSILPLGNLYLLVHTFSIRRPWSILIELIKAHAPQQYRPRQHHLCSGHAFMHLGLEQTERWTGMVCMSVSSLSSGFAWWFYFGRAIRTPCNGCAWQ